MKLIAQLTLLPTPQRADALLRTLETANAVCEAISRTAWETSTFQQFALHGLSYGATRGAFGLSAHVTVRCINKVVDAYRCNRTVRRTFKLHGSIAYDDVILS
jgi:hypothetical protein